MKYGVAFVFDNGTEDYSIVSSAKERDELIKTLSKQDDVVYVWWSKRYSDGYGEGHNIAKNILRIKCKTEAYRFSLTTIDREVLMQFPAYKEYMGFKN